MQATKFTEYVMDKLLNPKEELTEYVGTTSQGLLVAYPPGRGLAGTIIWYAGADLVEETKPRKWYQGWWK